MEGVIFDFNGTLFLDNDKHIMAWNAISKELRGHEISEEELHTKMNGINNQFIIRYLNGGKTDLELEQAYSQLKERYYRQFCLEDPSNFHLIEGAEALFEQLKESDIPFTIASASIKENIDFFVKRFHLDRWIDPASIVYDDGNYPDKESMFKKAAQNIGIPIEQVTVIEDSLAGVRAAKKAGVQDLRIIDSSHIKEKVESFPEVKQICDTMSAIRLDIEPQII